jgi:uncharacterized membrane protein YeaQ/YmgE (transglycosylase-associated protein family)
MTVGEFLTVLLIGLIAGWVTGIVMKGKGYGILADIILGIVGAVVGGFLFGQLGITAYGFLGRVAVAVVGTIVLVGIAHLLGGRTIEAKR